MIVFGREESDWLVPVLCVGRIGFVFCED
jgi:hypothetical protein